MTANALILGALGMALSFLPQEMANVLQLQSDPILLQLLGAGYMGFAMLNWMNKEKILGGIYGRPIVMANFAHFMIGGLALVKMVMKESSATTLLILTGVYVVFGVAFAFMVFKHPKINGDHK